MGAGASSILWADGDVGGQETGLGDLPEGCIAEVMLHLDPPGICKLAKLSRTFRGAASGDFVWETKLPSNYNYLLERASDDKELEVPLTKKEIFARLCRQNPFDGGTKEFWLEKYRGRFCMSISSKACLITGIDDRRYWNFIPTEESRFLSVAYLRQIWWLEVVGEIEFCFPPGTYSLYFRLHLGRPSRRLGRRICNTGHIHGWDIKPVRFQLWTSDGQHALCQSTIDDPGCWIRYHVGDFDVVSADLPIKVKFSMEQIDCTHTKGGLCVDSVLIYPKELKQEKFSTLCL
ncbi:F-box protein PP2-A13-like [Phalaenopsis equestris]|uniref:F-box protein PP2-A13-like n=1 Tax=Phalaenopsis equestris TaxID=78828 RepID=UPI0009E62637|nr:F-box protein PP2-A13-like [Phalaenopsis equestris]XP_020570940.1 F-box protein PP2-A13-like [Phalaenopsis equestris]